MKKNNSKFKYKYQELLIKVFHS